MSPSVVVASVIAALLVGGIPFGYLAGRLVLHDDIRRHGSGNIGATNVGRVLGWKWGSVVLFLDAMKGLLPTLAARVWASDNLPADSVQHLPVVVGVCAIIGHMFPIYLKFRGGKGVATALGVVLILAPWSSLWAFGVFAVTVAMTRIVGLASVLASVTFAVVQLYQSGSSAFTGPNWSLSLFSIGIPALIIWRHRSNISRLLRGQENRFSASGSQSVSDRST